MLIISNKKYVLYGTGWEAEKFLYIHKDLRAHIAYCIDAFRDEDFHGIVVKRLEEAYDLKQYTVIVAARLQTYKEIKGILEKRNLREFDDFIWSCMFNKKIVVVNANCLGEPIVNYLEQSEKFCSEFFVYPYIRIDLNREKELGDELIKHCDVFIHQDIRKENKIGYKLSDDYIVPKLKESAKNITIPNCVGMGKWLYPMQGPMFGKGKFGIDLGVVFTNYVLEEAFVLGLTTIEEYEKFYKEYHLDSKILDEEFKNGISKLTEREKNWDVKISKYILDNFKHTPCFVDSDHPSLELVKVIGAQVASILNINDIDDSGFVSKMGAPYPMLASVMNYHQIDYENRYEKARCIFTKEELVTVQDYIRYYLWCTHDVYLE